MRSVWSLSVVAVVVSVVLGAALFARAAESQDVAASGARRLAVLWTSGDPEVAHRVCLMYTHAAKRARWFDDVLLIVWGPSSRLLAADKDVQAKVKAMMGDGVQVKACIVCADSYGVTGRLRELGIEVKPMGKPLTDLLHSDWKVITF